MSVETAAPSEQRQLRANTIGLSGVLFQSITTMAPASAVSFSLGAAIPFTGSALPLAVLIALIVCSFIALSIGSLAKYLPSAGGYFTYVSESMGFHLGWLTGWMFDLAYMLLVPFQLLVAGPVMDSFVSTVFHISLGWEVWAIIFALIVFTLTFFGIKLSTNTGIVLGTIEISIFVVLSTWLIATSGNNTWAVFNPASSMQGGLGGWQGVLFGMIFVFLAFGGFEAAAPLAEEAKNPRRTVPQAIFLATLIIGIFYAFCSYAGIVGWGPAQVASYASNSDPWGAMALRVWGPFHIIVILAILNSALANANGCVNTASRTLYAMGRTKALPSILAHLNKEHTPDIAILFTMALAIVFSLLAGSMYGPKLGFAFLGTVVTLPIILVYMLTCVAVPFFYLRKHRDEFSVIRHILVPLIPFIILLFVLYFQFSPLPMAPLSFAGPIVAAWLIVGIIITVVLQKRSPDMLKESVKIYVEDATEDAIEDTAV